MTSVYRARNLAEATLVQHSLEERGIAARIRGSARTGLGGEIPIPEAMPEVCVEESSAGAARIVLATLALEAEGDEWACTACGETNPPTFDTCWKCEHER